MSKVILKRSSVSGKVPLVGDLEYGELAINYADGIAYFKKSDNTIGTIGSSAFSQAQNYTYTATSNQTTFACNYDFERVYVYLNGVKQVLDTDFTATTGTNIVFATGLIAGDIVDIVSYSGTNDIPPLPTTDVVGVADTQTLTNKTISFADNTLTGVQAELVSGTNIKTINNASLLGSGNISIVETDPIFVASPAHAITNSNISNWTLAHTWGNHASAGYLLSTTASTSYQPKDNDLTAIAGLVGNSGILKKTAVDTWSLDTNTYLTGNQSISLSGDATGSGTTSISLTLANSGVTAGTYGSSTNVPQVTVDAKGRVTTVSNVAVSIPSGSLTFTGDVTGTGTTGSSTTLTLSSIGTSGTYTKVTTDSKGRVTSGTTLSASDIPSLDAAKITTGVLDAARLPSYVDDVLEYTNLAGFPTTGETGKIYIALDTNKTYRWSGSTYVYITSGAVDSVAGKTGVVTLVKGDVGLGNVDNTADANKNVLSATKLTTARTISLTGDVTGSVSFDGSGNAAIATTIAADSVALGTDTTGNYVASVATTAPLSGGAVGSEGGTLTLSLAASYGDTQNPYASKTANYILAAPNGTAGTPTFRAIVAADIPTLNQNTTGSAATLTTARTLTIGSTGKTFNGSADVAWSLAEIGALGTTAKAADSELIDGIDSTRLVYGNGASGSNQASATQNVYELAQYKSGFWDVSNGAWAPTTTGWYWGATFAHTSNSASYNYAGQLAFQNNGGGNNIYARTITGGTASAWSKLLSSDNYSSYALPLSGGTMTGTITFTGAQTWPIFNQNTTGTASNVTGTVAVTNGGTGSANLTANSVLLGNGTSAVQTVAPGSSGNILVSNGTTWTSAAPSGVSTGKAIAMAMIFGF